MSEPSAKNWLEPPHNRIGFLRVAELTETVTIFRGESNPSSLPINPRSFDDLRIPFDERILDLHTWMEKTFTDGLLVIHDGTIVLEEYAGAMLEADRHLLMSISKSITSLLCGVLVGRGLLSTEDRVTDHLPLLRSTPWEGCTIQHLLDMTVGVAWDYERDEVDIMDVSGYRRHSRPELPPNTQAWITGTESHGRHGDAIRYVSLVTDVLGWVLEQAAGDRLEKLFTDHIWSQIGAEDDATLIVDRDQFRVAEGGISATLRDVGRLGMMCLDDGRAGGRQVVPFEWLERLRQPDHDLIALYRKSPESEARIPHAFYHNNWWISDAVNGHYEALGIHGQRVAIDHASNTVIVKLSSQPDMEDPALTSLDALGIGQLQKHLGAG